VIVLPTNVTSPTLGNAAFEDWARWALAGPVYQRRGKEHARKARHRRLARRYSAGGCGLPARGAQQQSAMPVAGLLDPRSSSDTPVDILRAFRQDLREAGYVEGENITIEYRWADNQIGRLPALASDLVRQRVAVIAATRSAPRRFGRWS